MTTTTYQQQTRTTTTTSHYYQMGSAGGGGGGGSSGKGFTPALVAMLFATSLMVLIWPAKWCDKVNEYGKCEEELAWAVACASVSLAFTVVYLAMFFVKGRSDAFMPSGTPALALCAFFAIWWAAGVAVLTFMSSHTASAVFAHRNVYFGCWLSLLICVKALSSVVPSAKMEGRDDQSYLLVAGIILLTQSAIDCNDYHCKDANLAALIVGILGVVIAIAAIFVEQARGLPLYACQVICWSVGWGLVTHPDWSRNGLWGGVGLGNNKYYSVTAGFLLSYKALFESVAGRPLSFSS